MKSKIIAFYLPQFHKIPENDKWWGKDYTEWENAKKAKPLFYGHYQPRIPLNQFYYNLLDESTMEWQMKLAKKYGVGGFCFYHYWFGDGRKLLEKPAEMLLHNPKATLPFCFAWTNEAWTRTWEGPGGEKHILMNQKYGQKDDWKIHFEYLLPFFRDKRYIKKDGKPILLIYRLDKITCYREMFDYWQELAAEYGLNGIYFIQMLTNKRFQRNYADAYATYVPGLFFNLRDDAVNNFKIRIAEFFPKWKLPKWLAYKLYNVFDYDECYKMILDKKYMDNEYMGAFPDFDNTARKGKKAAIWKGASPQKFENYLTEIIKRSDAANKDFIFLTAWNEWGEGNYLEPDSRYGFAYLKALRNALIKARINSGEGE